MVAAMISNGRRTDAPVKNPYRPPLIPSPHKGNTANPHRHPTKNISSSSTTKPLHSPRPKTSSAAEIPTAASRALCATTRTLPVSFQGEPYFLHTNKVKHPTSSATPARKPSQERQTSIPNGARNQKSSLMSRSLDFSSPMKEPVLAAVRLLRAFDDRSARLFLETGPQTQKTVMPKKLLVDGLLPSPHSPSSQSGGTLGSFPSIVSLAAEVKRVRKGEKRIEEAHLLRMLHNQYMQWRFVNARSNNALMAQRVTAEKDMHSAWIGISELHESVTAKRIELQLLKQNLKLARVLGQQMTCLEEWSLMERDHLKSLVGTTEALKGSTLRLPLTGGARADTQKVKNQVDSAIAVMGALENSIGSPLSKVERTSSMMSELAEIVAQEQAMLEQAKNILSMVNVLHVKQCSLQGYLLQMNQKSNPT